MRIESSLCLELSRTMSARHLRIFYCLKSPKVYYRQLRLHEFVHSEPWAVTVPNTEQDLIDY